MTWHLVVAGWVELVATEDTVAGGVVMTVSWLLKTIA
jgi:hypothetical protein